MKAILTVDHTVCRGSGLCQAMSPELFRLDDDGYGVAVQSELQDADDIEIASSVIECCPTEAIGLTVVGD